MDEKTLSIIRNNPLIYSFLREQSFHYKYLLSNPKYQKQLNYLAKEYYHQRGIDKINRFKEQLELIKTFIDVIE